MNNIERVTESTESTKPSTNVEFNPAEFSVLKQMQAQTDSAVSSKGIQQAHTLPYVEFNDPFKQNTVKDGIIWGANSLNDQTKANLLNGSGETFAGKNLGKEFHEHSREHGLNREDKLLHRELHTELKEEQTLKQEQRLLERELGGENKQEQKQTLKKEEGVLDNEFRVETREELNLKLDEKVQEREFRLQKEQVHIVHPRIELI